MGLPETSTNGYKFATVTEYNVGIPTASLGVIEVAARIAVHRFWWLNLLTTRGVRSAYCSIDIRTTPRTQ